MNRDLREKNQPMADRNAENEFCRLLDLPTLWKNRKTLYLCVGFTCLLGVIYLIQESPVYEAEARVLVQTNDKTQQNRGVRPDKQFWKTQAEIIRSPITLRRALKTVPITPDDGSDPLEYVLEALRVSTLTDTSVVKIGFRDTNEGRATQMIEAIIDSYRCYLDQSEHESYSETIRLLTQREKELMTEIEALKKEYQELRANTPALGQGRDALAVQMDTLRRLGNAITSTRSRRMDLQNKFRAATASPDSKSIGVFSANTGELVSATLLPRNADREEVADAIKRPELDGTFQNLPQNIEGKWIFPGQNHQKRDNFDPSKGNPEMIHKELRDLQDREITLSQTFGPKHPELRAVREKIELLQRKLEDSLRSSLDMAAQELEAFKMTESTLNEMYEEELKKAKELDAYLLKEQQLLESITKADQSHQATLASRTEVQLADQALASGQGSILVEILEGPQLSEERVWPKPVPFLFVCFAIGLVGGSVLIVLREQKDRLFGPLRNSASVQPAVHSNSAS